MTQVKHLDGGGYAGLLWRTQGNHMRLLTQRTFPDYHLRGRRDIAYLKNTDSLESGKDKETDFSESLQKRIHP